MSITRQIRCNQGTLSCWYKTRLVAEKRRAQRSALALRNSIFLKLKMRLNETIIAQFFFVRKTICENQSDNFI